MIKEERLIHFNSGDTIYHPIHGIGTVEAFETKNFAGTKATFATLYFPREDMRMMVPKKSLDDNVQPPLKKDEALEVLSFLEEWDGSLSKQWKVRQRKNQERLASGDAMELSTVYKGLRKIQDKKGRLNTTDRRQLAMAEKLLIEVLATALNKPEDFVEQRIDAAFETAA